MRGQGRGRGRGGRVAPDQMPVEGLVEAAAGPGRHRSRSPPPLARNVRRRTLGDELVATAVPAGGGGD
eukprot:1987823-Alexandrium_andersonii.AAC.1